MRTRDPAELAAYSGSHFIEIVFAELRFVSGTLYLHNTTLGDITWGGHTWQSLGEFGSVSDIEESSDLGIRAFTLTLSGIEPDLLATALDRTDYKGREAIVYLGVMDEDYQLVATPKEVARGLMDTARIERSNKTGAISMVCEPESVRLLRGSSARISAEDHKRRHPNDSFFDQMVKLVDKDVMWGPSRVGPSGGGYSHNWRGRVDDYNQFNNWTNDGR